MISNQLPKDFNDYLKMLCDEAEDIDYLKINNQKQIFQYIYMFKLLNQMISHQKLNRKKYEKELKLIDKEIDLILKGKKNINLLQSLKENVLSKLEWIENKLMNRSYDYVFNIEPADSSLLYMLRNEIQNDWDSCIEKEYIYGFRLIYLYTNLIKKHPMWNSFKNRLNNLKEIVEEVYHGITKLKDKELQDIFIRNSSKILKEQQQNNLNLNSSHGLINKPINNIELLSFNSNLIDKNDFSNNYNNNNNYIGYNNNNTIENNNQSNIKKQNRSSITSVRFNGSLFNNSINNDYATDNDRKTVYINRRLIDGFLNFAFENLEKDLEFCGILSGIPVGNSWKITHCIIPEQNATKDSCCATNETDLFNYQFNNNLQPLGWIHTHPTQSTFLSTVDLVTQYGYQLMIPESIAIVCAPKSNPPLGIFRIKDSAFPIIENAIAQDEMIAKGRKHAILSYDPLFEPCDNVVCSYETNLESTVVDLRHHSSISHNR